MLNFNSLIQSPYIKCFSYLQHPNFAWDTSEGDDLGVMHLTTTLEFSDSIQPITLSQETNVDVWADATGCYITGWGNSKSQQNKKKKNGLNSSIFSLL